MSLLNQVLRDLENHPLPDVARPTLRLASSTQTPAPRRARRLPWLIGGTLLLLAAGSIWWWFENRQAPPSIPVSEPTPAASPAAEHPDPVPPPSPSEEPSMSSVAAPRDHLAAPEQAASLDSAGHQANDNEETDSPPRHVHEQTPPPAAPATTRPAIRPSSHPVIRKAPAASPLAAIRKAIDQGELSLAEDLLRQRLQRHPDDRAARRLLIGLLVRGERREEALREITRALTRSGHDDTLVLLRARLWVDLGDTATALRGLTPLLARPRPHHEAMRLAAALYRQSGELERAGRLYQRLTALPDASGSDWLGLALSLDDRAPALARAAWQRVLGAGDLPPAVRDYARQRLEALQ